MQNAASPTQPATDSDVVDVYAHRVLSRDPITRVLCVTLLRDVLPHVDFDSPAVIASISGPRPSARAQLMDRLLLLIGASTVSALPGSPASTGSASAECRPTYSPPRSDLIYLFRALLGVGWMNKAEAAQRQPHEHREANSAAPTPTHAHTPHPHQPHKSDDKSDDNKKDELVLSRVNSSVSGALSRTASATVAAVAAKTQSLVPEYRDIWKQSATSALTAAVQSITALSNQLQQSAQLSASSGTSAASATDDSEKSTSASKRSQKEPEEKHPPNIAAPTDSSSISDALTESFGAPFSARLLRVSGALACLGSHLESLREGGHVLASLPGRGVVAGTLLKWDRSMPAPTSTNAPPPLNAVVRLAEGGEDVKVAERDVRPSDELWVQPSHLPPSDAQGLVQTLSEFLHTHRSVPPLLNAGGAGSASALLGERIFWQLQRRFVGVLRRFFLAHEVRFFILRCVFDCLTRSLVCVLQFVSHFTGNDTLVPTVGRLSLPPTELDSDSASASASATNEAALIATLTHCEQRALYLDGAHPDLNKKPTVFTYRCLPRVNVTYCLLVLRCRPHRLPPPARTPPRPRPPLRVQVVALLPPAAPAAPLLQPALI